jgi:hypothetical protein
MKAKLVKEYLNEFHQTSDPLSSLGIGPYEEYINAFMDEEKIPKAWYKVVGKKTIFLDNNSLFLNDSNLRELPDGLVIPQLLSVENCKNLEKLPNNLNVGGLNLARCYKLEKLPNDLIIADFFKFNDGTKVYQNIMVSKGQKKLIKFIEQSKFAEKLTMR